MKPLILALFLSISPSFSQWESFNPLPDYTWLYSVFFVDDSNGWIAGASGTILKYDSQKLNWEMQSRITPNDLFSISFFNTTTGITCGRFGTLLRSTDGGFSWSAVSLNTSSDLHKVFVLNETTAYVAGNSGMLYKTTDMGLSWMKVTLPGNYNIKSVYFINNQTGFIGTDSAKILKTIDGGIQWSETALPWNVSWSVNKIQFLNDSTGYAGGGKGVRNGGGALAKTTDGGLSWIPEDYSFYNIKDFAFSASGDGIIAGGENGWNKFLLYRSPEEYVSIYYHPEDFDINSCFITPSGKAWAVGGGGTIYSSENISSGWQKFYSGAGYTNRAIAVKNNIIFASISGNIYKGSFSNQLLRYSGTVPNNDYYSNVMVAADSQTIFIKSLDFYKTTDAGATWLKINNHSLYNMFFINRDTGWSTYFDRISMTTNGGLTWQHKYTAPQYNLVRDICFPDNLTGFATVNNVVIKSTDGGNSWSTLNNPYISTLDFISFATPDRGAAAGRNGKMIITTDGGLTWRTVESGYYIYDIEFFRNILAAATYEGKVLISTDYGSSWSEDDLGNSVYSLASDGERYLLAMTRSNIFRRDFSEYVPVELLSLKAEAEQGHTIIRWTTATELNNYGFEVEKRTYGEYYTIGFRKGAGNSTEVQHYSFKDVNLVPGIKNFYRLKQIDMNGSFTYSAEVEVETVSYYKLEQNYPNPFNPLTRINFAVPEKIFVKMVLYDALGQKIRTLIEEEKLPGTYSIELNAEKLSSGTYFYSMTAGDFVSVKKIIVIK
jgi:photosystem II stability/assembly factor-like uncharacterized protein